MWSTRPAVLSSNTNPDLQAAPGVWGKPQTGDKERRRVFWGKTRPQGQGSAEGGTQIRGLKTLFAQAPPAAATLASEHYIISTGEKKTFIVEVTLLSRSL